MEDSVYSSLMYQSKQGETAIYMYFTGYEATYLHWRQIPLIKHMYYLAISITSHLFNFRLHKIY